MPSLEDFVNSTDTPAEPTAQQPGSLEAFVAPELEKEKFGTAGQTAISALEGAGRGVVGPLAPMAEKALGVPEGDILARRRVNPIASGAGEIAGLVGGAATGTGEGGLLALAGKDIGSLVSHKIASSAIKGAAEAALYQSGDELSKAVLHDPAQSVGSAVASVGLSGLLGGSLGAISGSVSPLWQATVGKRLSSVLSKVAEASGGIEGQEAAEAAGPRLDPFTKEPLETAAPTAPKQRASIDPFTKEPLSEAPAPTPRAEVPEAAPGPGFGSALKEAVGGNALSLLLAATGHGHAAILTKLADILRKPGMEVLKRASLKFLGTAKPVSAEGFSAMADMMGAAAKGSEMVDNASNAVFSGGRVVAADKMPSKDDVKKLDETIKHLEENPGALLGKADHLGHYLPDHSVAVAEIAANAQNYLNGLRPRADKQSPLDRDPEVSKAASSPFNRALQLAQQPLLALQHIKDGTLVPQDVQTVERLYPKLYRSLADKLTESLIEHTSKGGTVNYHTQQALSLFAGHPLNSTLQPQAIQAAQMTHQPKQAAPQPPAAPKSTKSKLGALASESATPDQQRAMHRAAKD